MKKTFVLIMTALVLSLGCQSEPKDSQNPLLQPFNTPYNVPPLDKIKTEHYLPAFEMAMQQQKAEIDAIVQNPEAPTFENTIVALDRSGSLLSTIGGIFFTVYEADADEKMQELAQQIMPMYSKHSNEISLNEQLFQRIKTVYEQRNELNLADDELRVLEKYYTDFTRNGANLNENDKNILKQINEDLSVLYLNFEQNLLSENKDFKLIISNKEDLKGLPEEVISAAAKASGEKGKWVFTMAKPSWIPFLQYAENRDLRQALYKGWFKRGDNDNEFDNKTIIDKIVNLRLKKANLLGFNNFAAYKIDNNMAKTPQAVQELLQEVWEVALPVAKSELADLQEIVRQEGGNFDIQPWDWWFYSEKIRKAKYSLEESELKPYFSLENTKAGMFYVAERLYGITFTKVNNIPVYHRDVEVFEAREADGTLLGIFYMDYHPRDGKGGGAWCTSFRDGQYNDAGEREIPLISIVCNFTEATGKTPALLNWDEVTTLFHEFGHGLHGLFSDGRFHRTAGEMPRDMVELPSQFMENYAGDPSVLKVYAKHYKTGEIIPDELITKIQNSSTFNIGFETCELIAASILDQNWHTITTEKMFDVNRFEQEAMDAISLIPEILPRYRSTYYAHIFGSEGYAAGYYVYTWAEVLDADAFDAFRQTGDIFQPELAARFREHVLANSGKGEGMVQYEKFRGQAPEKEPYFVRRGLR